MSKRLPIMRDKNYIVYLIIIGISIFVSLNLPISYALLSIFIPESKLPLELGIAKIIGEQGNYIVELMLNSAIWFILFLIISAIYKRMAPKKFIIFLILSPIVWIMVTIAIEFIDIFVFNNFKINLFWSSCGGAGYPISKISCYEEVLSVFKFLNISFWFLMIWFTWEQLIKRIFHSQKIKRKTTKIIQGEFF